MKFSVFSFQFSARAWWRGVAVLWMTGLCGVLYSGCSLIRVDLGERRPGGILGPDRTREARSWTDEEMAEALVKDLSGPAALFGGHGGNGGTK